MIVDIRINKKFQAIIKELFIRCRKLNILLVFITQFYFYVPKDVRLNSTHCLIIKINKRKVLWNIVINVWADIHYNNFVRIYWECTRKPYSSLTIDATLLASDPLRFRKNFLPSYKNIVAETQYDLDRKAAKVFALFSNNFDKYEYLTQ